MQGLGRKIAMHRKLDRTANASTTTFDDYDFHEKNKYNFLKSGRQWFGERIDYSAFDTTFQICQPCHYFRPVKLKANVLSRSAFLRTFHL